MIYLKKDKDILCQVCNSIIENYYDEQNSKLIIKPCFFCMQMEYTKGYNTGMTENEENEE